MEDVGPRWAQSGAPKGKKGANFKNLLLQTEKELSHNILYVGTFIYEECTLFMANARMAPVGPWRVSNLRDGGGA